MEIHARPLIIVAPDSFKESLSAEDACLWIAKGIRAARPRAKIRMVPMADGGEGTLEILCRETGKILRARVTGPLGRKVSARWGVMDRGRTAVIEMAQASGLSLVPPSKRNPLAATSFGAGELIRKALDRGCRKIILTLGGVATSDAGAGIAQALGFRFLDKDGGEIPPGAGGLKFLRRIDASGAHPKIKRTKFLAACDVKNPLAGKWGSARVYGPQKGATPAMVKMIEDHLARLAKIVRRDLNLNVARLPGGGAAGGAGAGAVAFLGARLERGIEIVLDAVQFEKKIRGADLLITGEGKIDGQTVFGKTISGVAKAAKKQGIPVIAFCGQLGKGHEKIRALGVRSVTALMNSGVSYRESLRNAGPLLKQSVERELRSRFELI